MPETPLRKFRDVGELWEPSAAKAERHGVTVSDVIRDGLAQWIAPADVAIGDTVRLVGPGREPELYEVVDGDGGPTLRKVET